MPRLIARPTLVEAVTYRYHGHNTGEVAGYRTDEEVEEWRRTRDPIDGLRRAMEAAGLLDGDRYDEMFQAARSVLQASIEFSENSPIPDPARERRLATRENGATDTGVSGRPTRQRVPFNRKRFRY